MIVLDEQIKDRYLLSAIAVWYPGTVTHIQALRPATVVKDDGIAALLRTVERPTFITINVDDFWQKIEAHDGYCVIAIEHLQDDIDTLSARLRSVLSIPAFRTRSSRMGKVIRVQSNQIRFYERNRLIQSVS